MVGKYKWEAWSKLGDMEKTEAMQQYVEHLLETAARLPPSEDVNRFVEAVTPVKKPFVTPDKPATSERVDDGTMAEVQQAEEQLSREVAELREAVQADGLKVTRLETLLDRSSLPEELDGELSGLLQTVAQQLVEGQSQQKQVLQRLEGKVEKRKK
jgi:hypothetical protein